MATDRLSITLSALSAWVHRESPAFIICISASFGLGLWVAAATFAYARYYVFREPAGVHNAALLQRLQLTRAGQSPYALASVLSQDELELLQRSRGDWHVEGYALRDAQMEVGGRSRTLTVAVSTTGLLRMLGVHLRVGGFPASSARDVSANSAAVISDRLWREAFGRSSFTPGTAIRIDGRPIVVAGILPPDFSGVDRQPTDIWLPLEPIESGPPGSVSSTYFLSALVRLSSLAEAPSVTSRILGALAESSISRNPVASVALRPLSSDRFGDEGLRRVAPYALSLAAAVLLLALCNCLLLLAGRVHEAMPHLRIRSALGAPTVRLWTDIATAPALFMSATALLTLGTLRWSLLTFRVTGLPHPDDLLDAGTLLVMAAIAITSITSVLWAAFRLHRRELEAPGMVPTLYTPARHRFRHGLACCYLAVTSALAVAVVPIAHAYANASNIDPGFDPRFAIAVRADINRAHRNAGGYIAIHHILDQLAALPSVRSAAASTSLPFGITTTAQVALQRSNDQAVPVHLYRVVGDVLGALGVSIKAGGNEKFASADSRVVVINEALAGIWPDSPLGKCIHLNGDQCSVISGIASNSNVVTLGEAPRPVAYARMRDSEPPATVYFIVRTMSDLTPVTIASLKDVVERAYPGMLVRAATLAEMVREQSASIRQFVRLNLLLLGIACILGYFGLRAIVILTVEARRRDLGVLAAVGAPPTKVFIACCRELALVAAASSIAGYALGLLFTRLLATQLDLPLAVVTEQLAVVILLPVPLVLSAAIPAWKASRMEPAGLLAAQSR